MLELFKLEVPWLLLPSVLEIIPSIKDVGEYILSYKLYLEQEELLNTLYVCLLVASFSACC